MQQGTGKSLTETPLQPYYPPTPPTSSCTPVHLSVTFRAPLPHRSRHTTPRTSRTCLGLHPRALECLLQHRDHQVVNGGVLEAAHQGLQTKRRAMCTLQRCQAGQAGIILADGTA